MAQSLPRHHQCPEMVNFDLPADKLNISNMNPQETGIEKNCDISGCVLRRALYRPILVHSLSHAMTEQYRQHITLLKQMDAGKVGLQA